jgi:hypothetical protein
MVESTVRLKTVCSEANRLLLEKSILLTKAGLGYLIAVTEHLLDHDFKADWATLKEELNAHQAQTVAAKRAIQGEFRAHTGCHSRKPLVRFLRS